MCARTTRYSEFKSRVPALAARTCAHRSRAHRAPLPARHNDQNLNAILHRAFVYNMSFTTMRGSSTCLHRRASQALAHKSSQRRMASRASRPPRKVKRSLGIVLRATRLLQLSKTRSSAWRSKLQVLMRESLQHEQLKPQPNAGARLRMQHHCQQQLTPARSTLRTPSGLR